MTINIKNKQDGFALQVKDAAWHIETLGDPEHLSDAHKRLDYLNLMPKLALFCLVSEWLYLGYRIFLATKAPDAQTSAYVFLSIEVCAAGQSILSKTERLCADLCKLRLDLYIYKHFRLGVKPNSSFLLD